MALFKKSTALQRSVATANQTTEAKVVQGQNGNIGMPLVFGTALYEPTVVARYAEPVYDKNAVLAADWGPGAAADNEPYGFRNSMPFTANANVLVIYVLSLDQSGVFDLQSNKLQSIFLNGRRLQDIATTAPWVQKDRGSRLNRFNDADDSWKYGNRCGAWFEPEARNADQQTIAMFEVVNTTQTTSQLLEAFNIDYTLQDNVVYLIAHYALTNAIFDEDEPELIVQFSRAPKVRDPADSYRFEAEEHYAGNCVYELMASNYGLGLDQTSFDYTNFKDQGSYVDCVFDVTKDSILDIINTITQEDFSAVDKIGNVYSYVSMTGTSVDFTVDENSIYDIEIIYPDATSSVDRVIANYFSFVDGSRQYTIGGTDSSTNVQTIDIKSKGTTATASLYVQRYFAKINSQKTYKISMDKVAQKFTVGSVISITTTVPNLTSETMRITSVTIKEDQNVEVEAESLLPTLETPVLTSARKLLAGAQAYRPPLSEPVVLPPDAPLEEPIIPTQPARVPPPGSIAPADPDLLTISGLNHPYNFNTGADNTDWYLGSSNDLNTADTDNFDTNGIQTRAVDDGGLIYHNGFSLIHRVNDAEKPMGIVAAYDISLDTSEIGWVGTTIQSSESIYARYQYKGFFKDELLPANVYRSGYGFLYDTNQYNWAQFKSLAIVSKGTDPRFETGSAFDAIYQTSYENSRYDRLRAASTFPPQNLPRNLNFSIPTGPLQTEMRKSGVYRVHFSAIYGTELSINGIQRAEYIGSSSFYGDGRGVLPDFQDNSRVVWSKYTTDAYPYVYTSPPARNIS